jgi:hypothetical protein
MMTFNTQVVMQDTAKGVKVKTRVKAGLKQNKKI